MVDAATDRLAAAAAAVRRGDRAHARALLDSIGASEAGVSWTVIGRLEEALGEVERAVVAYSRALTIAPRDLPALLSMGALHMRSGRDRDASACYRTALAVASEPGFRAPPDLHPMLHEAQAFLQRAESRFRAHLDAVLAPTETRTSNRMRYALDLLMGRSELFLQQPSMFYFPELPQRSFYERSDFEWLTDVEAHAGAMLAELEGVIGEKGEFAPYVERPVDRPPPASHLLEDPSWGAEYLWRGGADLPGARKRCPTTMAALDRAPMPYIKGRSPMALYSLLRPGTHIKPHHGLLNTRLICHIPLIAPPGCALRVGAETREWRYGEALIFDDSVEHEAWNRGDSTRIVLLFEIWRPEISPEEREILTKIFTAIDEYNGTAVDTG